MVSERAMTGISGSRTLHRLIYCSHQAGGFAMDDGQIEEILAASIRNNGRASITGLLLVHGGRFVQALEGPAEPVMHTYRRILADPRHDRPKVLSAGPAQGREFAAWSMCARRISAADDAILDTLSQREAFEPEALSGAAALRLLTAVRGIQRRTESAAQS
jgi:hypothetical protein